MASTPLTVARDGLVTSHRALQVDEHANMPAMRRSTFTCHLGALHVHFGQIVREVQSDYIDTGLNQLVEDLGVVGRGSEGGNNLGSAQQCVSSLNLSAAR